MAIKILFLLLAAVGALKAPPARAVEEYPFERSFSLPQAGATSVDPFTGMTLPQLNLPVDHSLRHPVCASEESFFKHELSFKQKVQGNAAFIFKGAKAEYVGMDFPFSHEANAQSLLMVEEEDARAQEKAKIAQDHHAKGQWQVVEQAQAELSRTEEQLQEMAKQAWDNPALAQDPSFLDSRKQLLQMQAMVQNKVLALKDKLISEQQGEAVKSELAKASFDVWYINMNKSTQRKDCLERQLKEAGIENVNRYPAVEIRGMTKQDRKKLFMKSKNPKEAQRFYTKQLQDLGYGDCVEGGIDFDGTSTHGSQTTNEWHTRSAVIANYCGHKRLLKEQEANKTASEYIVLMEDDVIVDRTWFKVVIEDFIQNFDKHKKWSMVQLDPFGYKSSEDFVGHFRGKPVYKPQFKAPCSQYWGFQAVIFRKSALPEINRVLSENPAMPIDWLQYKVDGSLAFSSLIARNPESLSNENWMSAVEEKRVVLPSFCAKTVMKSTIARQVVTKDMFK